MTHLIQKTFIIPETLAGLRLDQAVAKLLPEYSRSKIKSWIDDGQLLVKNQSLRPKDKIKGNETIILNASLTEKTHDLPEDIALDIAHEDDELIIINKPVGLVVHPAAGNQQGTLLNALLHHCPQLSTLPRAGIVHRIDKDTSGLLIIAKTLSAYTSLVDQLQKREISREYEAIVMGEFTGGGKVDAPIGRHPRQRLKMAVTASGKPAVTHYRIIKKYAAYTHIQVKLETGRTHQIRVHMAHILHPIVGDQLYAGRPKLPKNASPELIDCLKTFKRQALHAKKLGLTHPRTKQWVEWEVPLPADMKQFIALCVMN